MSIWFSSDYHFGHEKVQVYCNRPCEPTKESVNAWIVQQHNSVVGPKDDFYFNGDISLGLDYDSLAEQVSLLNGKNKFFIIGNHDNIKYIQRLYLERIISGYDYYKELKIKPNNFVMSHYPMFEWSRGHHGTIMLHGHTHGSYKGKYPFKGKIIDTGIDGHPNKVPYSLDEILLIASTMEVYTHH